MKIKYALLSLVLLGTSLPSFVSAKSETTPNRQASTFTPEQYQVDWDRIAEVVENTDMSAIMELDEEASQVEDLQSAINATKPLRSAIQKAQLITPEGKQVKLAFIAFCDDLIKMFVDINQWKDDENLQKEYTEKLKQHHDNMLNSLHILKQLTEQ